VTSDGKFTCVLWPSKGITGPQTSVPASANIVWTAAPQ
jgi:hypothetical protein